MEPIFLQVNERAGELDQAFVKRAVRFLADGEPQILQYIMRLVEKLLVEVIKIAEVMRVQNPPAIFFDHQCDLFVLFQPRECSWQFIAGEGDVLGKSRSHRLWRSQAKKSTFVGCGERSDKTQVRQVEIRSIRRSRPICANW